MMRFRSAQARGFPFDPEAYSELEGGGRWNLFYFTSLPLRVQQEREPQPYWKIYEAGNFDETFL